MMIRAVMTTTVLLTNILSMNIPATEYPIMTLNMIEHNEIFDEFIDDKEEQGYECIRETFTDEFIKNLVDTSVEYGVDPWLVVSVIEAESSFNPDARAYDGSKHYGLMQLSVHYFSEALALEGTDDFFDPIANVSVGIKELARLLDSQKDYRCVKNSTFKHPGESLAVLSYHKGEGDAIPLFRENEVDSYTEKVIDNWQYYRNTYEKE